MHRQKCVHMEKTFCVDKLPIYARRTGAKMHSHVHPPPCQGEQTKLRRSRCRSIESCVQSVHVHVHGACSVSLSFSTWDGYISHSVLTKTLFIYLHHLFIYLHHPYCLYLCIAFFLQEAETGVCGEFTPLYAWGIEEEKAKKRWMDNEPRSSHIFYPLHHECKNRWFSAICPLPCALHLLTSPM